MDTRSRRTGDRPGKRTGASIRAWRHAGTWRVAGAVLAAAAVWAWTEMYYSELQARLFAGVAQGLSFRVEPGANPDLWLPQSGPYDIRMGYSRMNDALPRLASSGYRIQGQARQSLLFNGLARLGLNPIYREKSQAGLRLLDRRGEPLYQRRYPERHYAAFESIPPVLVSTLLYVENRELLDDGRPLRNPAVEWDRLARALMGQAARSLDSAAPRPGGSTLATQIEKYRHSPEGRTRDAAEKLRQMLSASLRSYLDGEQTLAARRRIVVDFVNSVPLGSVPGHGEVIGLGDGLWAWYGRDFDGANRLLAGGDADPASFAQAFKETLSLIIAQRRPSELLGEKRDRLAALTESYLRILARDGVISPLLRDAALAAPLDLRSTPASPPPASFVLKKGVNAARVSLAGLLGLDNLYTLDHHDLDAHSTLDGPAQSAVTAFLSGLADESTLRRGGFTASRLLARGDPRQVRFSFTLYEASPMGNLLRVQADNLDQPFDINVGVKLDLGSSAKLRTLVTYLEAVAELHARYAGLPREALAGMALHSEDRLSRWAVSHLAASAERSLPRMLDAALQRRYSASPAETFFTGGGEHRFANFRREDDARVPTVAEALEQSINLAFIRLMRDLVHYHAYEAADAPGLGLREGDAGARRHWLLRFADLESQQFLRQFWHKYRGRAPDELLPALAASVRPEPRRLAIVFHIVEPEGDYAAFAAFMRGALFLRVGDEASLKRLYAASAADRFDLADRAYLARVHPLELWLVAYRKTRPQADFAEAVAASAAERQAAYRWLFNSKLHQAQDLRIGIALEAAAFERIAASWRRLGYPFERLVPSLASAIGASADRPSSLAALVGIVVNGGVRRPQVRIAALHFAADTPFETLLAREAGDGVRVMQAEVAEVLRRALLRVVEGGTARRLKGVYRSASGDPLPLGGKTGTGDHRYEVYNRGGQLMSSRVVNRAATFAFFIGERYFGTVTAYVAGELAAGYDFTSALPVQMLRQLEPILRPLLAEPPATAPGTRADADAAGRDRASAALHPLL
ncbi:MAG: hypothetical protein A3H35_12715 [Betaproteobacteria bacterium RIFCSPLOWO2_02_FULL_62_17]|nr:MAG: hypothetical protein A3H35_12715 [Betaproteobacteria bacterium RIFCSPLOWO2_02_FULL_62_17]